MFKIYTVHNINYYYEDEDHFSMAKASGSQFSLMAYAVFVIDTKHDIFLKRRYTLEELFENV